MNEVLAYTAGTLQKINLASYQRKLILIVKCLQTHFGCKVHLGLQKSSNSQYAGVRLHPTFTNQQTTTDAEESDRAD